RPQPCHAARSRLQLCEIEASRDRRFCGKIDARRGGPGLGGSDGDALRLWERSLDLNQRRGRISTEVELKLAASAGYLPELKRALAAMAPEAESSRRRLISTYYDTPDLALKRRGLTLRVREQGGRFVQTVKAGDL